MAVEGNYGEPNKLNAGEAALGPLIVVVRVTTECFLSCQFCGFSQKLQRPARQISDDHLQLLGRALQRHSEVTGRRILVSWLGGEPLQWNSLLSMSRRFVEEYGLELSVTTNGLRLQNKELRQSILNLFGEITFSVDGLAEYHDALRKSPGMFARLKLIIQKTKDEREPGKVLLRVNTVLTRSNIGKFREFAIEVASWGVEELTYNPLGGNDRPEFYPANRLQSEQLLRFRAEMSETSLQAASLGLTIRGAASYLDRMLATVEGRCLSVAECWPGRDFLFVDELGRLSPCSFTSGTFDTDLTGHCTDLESWRSKFRERRLRQRPQACNDCHANHVYTKFG
jgi:MoaA/NifB/PqqE/SkfB family radical SAM enzyme